MREGSRKRREQKEKVDSIKGGGELETKRQRDGETNKWTDREMDSKEDGEMERATKRET